MCGTECIIQYLPLNARIQADFSNSLDLGCLVFIIVMNKIMEHNDGTKSWNETMEQNHGKNSWDNINQDVIAIKLMQEPGKDG